MYRTLKLKKMKNKKNLLLATFCLFFTVFSFGQTKKYCYTLSSGKYVLTLYDDGSKKVSYDLYSLSGVLQKTVQGIWMIRDEGVYGPSYFLTISWTGVNSNLQDLKYVVQYDGNGNLQALIDGTGRTWNSCR